MPVDTATYASGATVTTKLNTGNLAKTGYLFSGWNTNATGTGTTAQTLKLDGTETKSKLGANALLGVSLAAAHASGAVQGTVTQAQRSGWPIPPTFLGTILLYVLGFGFLLKLLRLARFVKKS